MGVDFYTCAVCSYNFPDCGDYVSCEKCYNHFCSNKCAEVDYSEENETCCICRKEFATDSDLLDFLLEHIKLTREQAMEIYRGK